MMRKCNSVRFSPFNSLFPEAPLSQKDVAYILDSAASDPEVDAAVKAYMLSAFAGKAAPASGSDDLALAAKVEKKYASAQIVAQGVQNIALPLSYDSKDTSPVKRYAAELAKLASKAGFEDAATEVEKRLTEKAKTAESVKEFLVKVEAFASPDFHSAVSEALAQIESETNSTVTMDSSSAGYKKFAAKVQSIASAHNIPWKTLVDAKKPDSGDAVKKAYQAWTQSARLSDALAEVEVLRSEATALLDKHLTKTAEQVKSDQEASVSSLQKKIEAAKGTKWADKFAQDLQTIAWFDAQVQKQPAVGPKASV